MGYLDLMFKNDDRFNLLLCYILPALPPILVEESRKSSKTAKQLAEMEKRNLGMAEQILSDTKELLIEKGFAEDRIETTHQKQQIGTARDICSLSENKRVDAVAIATRGRSKLEAFFTGEVANKVLELHRSSPVWMIKGAVKERSVLLAVDCSENALRAADHAGFILRGTGCPIVLFHSKRHLRRFVPQEVIDTAPELENLWQHAAGREIAAYMDKAKGMLLSAGVQEDLISIKIVDGSRSPANDILEAAGAGRCGTIVIGRKGFTGESDFSIGDVARKVLSAASDTAVWVVS
jgi:nucleotide-binding universal stress UspA family protein